MKNFSFYKNNYDVSKPTIYNNCNRPKNGINKFFCKTDNYGEILILDLCLNAPLIIIVTPKEAAITWYWELRCSSKLEIRNRNSNTKSKLESEARNWNSKSKLNLEIETRNSTTKSKLEIEARNWNSKSKLKLEIRSRTTKLKLEIQNRSSKSKLEITTKNV